MLNPTCDIRLFLTDVDGTLTDGGMYYTATGDTMKKFNTRDGMGLQLLQKAGVKVGIITSENTPIVSRRAEKLGIDFLVQGKRDGGKLAAAREICDTLGISLAEMAYIGDDVNCAELLRHAGIAACPADAMPQVKAIPGIRIMTLKGGEGCVREFINELLPAD
ncbi:MAG: HAD-IIIA family hydrolase [Muribaculaceae bacterium]|nr:HAD-IIIA family hydrolase [Muribaculaceae bacterium]